MLAKFINENKIELWNPKPNRNYIEYYDGDVKMIRTNPSADFLKSIGYKELVTANPPKYDPANQKLIKEYVNAKYQIIEKYLVITV